MEPVTWWSLFVKLVAYFSFSETCTLIIPYCETGFVHGTCCILISFLKFVSVLIFCFGFAWIFVHGTSCVMIFLDLSIRKTCTLYFSLYQTDILHRPCCLFDFCSRYLLCADFVHVTCCKLIFLFVKLIHLFFSTWNWFFHFYVAYCMLVLFIRFVTSWLFSL